MRLDDFDFDLPENCIALRPAAPRDTARLLEVTPGGAFVDRIVSDLPGQLRSGDALVLNDTRVIPARLHGMRAREGSIARIEATLLARLSPSRWTALARPGKRLESGDRISFGEATDRACYLTALNATVAGKGESGEISLEFDLAGAALDDAIGERGAMPLPPYIATRREEDEQDFTDYQTVYARVSGSVAAPTAGLHFTPELLRAVEAAGVSVAYVTLHVGAGTFLPVKAEDLAAGRLHAEMGYVTEETAERLNTVRAAGGRIICAGTTSLRLIETAAGEDGKIRPFAGETRLFITPGYRFKAVDGLLTNFHLPRSSLFMLVCAFAGRERMRAAYAHAVAERYRFYSYGDATLLWRR